jgi:hypothetical protein
MIYNLHQQLHAEMTRVEEDEDMSLSNGSLSDVQEEGSAMNLMRNPDKSVSSNSMSANQISSHKLDQTDEKRLVPALNFNSNPSVKKKNSSPIKDDGQQSGEQLR